MRIDRAELAGTGDAIAFHAALIAAMSLSLAHVVRPPETPSMEVELVDEVGLQPAAPAVTAAPPPPSQAPAQGTDLTPAPPQPEPLPTPQITPAPQITPTLQQRLAPNSLGAQAAELKPALKRPATPHRAAPSRPAAPTATARPRVSRIGDDFLKGLADAPASKNPPASTAPAKPAAPAISASAMAGIQQAIRRRVQPCADRQVNPGPGASRIKVKLHLVLSRAGRLMRAPEVIATSGVDDDNSRYEERVKDLAVATFTGCAPLTGLPQELYQTANGGWSNFNMTYSLP